MVVRKVSLLLTVIPPKKLSLRSSMLKFESENRMLNVTKWSEYGACYLNREIVTLLPSLGVKDEAFEAMQQEQLCLLRRMLTNREAALKVLESVNGPSYRRGKDGNILVKMLHQGYEPNVEPYLSMMLQAHYEYLLSDVRGRCRIFVPKGRVLIGCLDETGLLSYGKVYVRVTMTKEELQCVDQSFFQKVDEESSVVIGKVIVTKNPCLHPGDVRVLVLEAVYEVKLEVWWIVLCFPRMERGLIPMDVLVVTLMEISISLAGTKISSRVKLSPPMDYTARRPRIMDHDATLEEIQKFFVDYMISDTLGSISTAHLIHADLDPNKAISPKCVELATLHSMAVDFAETGAPAEMPKVLKPREFPDFMGRGDRSTYKSNSVLGKLYRATLDSTMQETPSLVWSEKVAQASS